MTEPNVTGDGRTVTIRIPISIRRRGGRKLVLAPDGTNVTTVPVYRHIDNAMVKTTLDHSDGGHSCDYRGLLGRRRSMSPTSVAGVVGARHSRGRLPPIQDSAEVTLATLPDHRLWR
jgi:hypothetical protein